MTPRSKRPSSKIRFGRCLPRNALNVMALKNRKVIFESITERPFLQVERLARKRLFQVSLLRVS